MHKGRTYPFFPEWWVDESHFWPALPPWKCLCFVVDILDPSMLPLVGMPAFDLSDACIAPDAHSVRYQWPTPWTAAATDFTISVGRADYLGTPYSRWHAQLSLSSVPVGDTYMWQPFDPATFATEIYRFFSVDSPLGAGFQSIITVVPASYAQGGSPYE